MTTPTKGRACDGKKRHTAKTARKEVRRLTHRGAAPGRMIAYACPHADDGHWHVGHTSRKKR